jgi:hypothetical protein
VSLDPNVPTGEECAVGPRPWQSPLVPLLRILDAMLSFLVNTANSVFLLAILLTVMQQLGL